MQNLIVSLHRYTIFITIIDLDVMSVIRRRNFCLFIFNLIIKYYFN
jgi:hypothetical protein